MFQAVEDMERSNNVEGLVETVSLLMTADCTFGFSEIHQGVRVLSFAIIRILLREHR